MILTSLKIALRSFIRNRFFTFFNLLSLVGGLFIAFVAIEYISYENSYDKFHKESENIYRLGWTYRSQDYSILGFDSELVEKQLDLVNGLKDIPEIAHATQFITNQNPVYIEWEGKKVAQKDVLTTNTPSEFVNVFSWNTLFGNLENFGVDSKKVILTQSTAKKLFGEKLGNSQGIIGQEISIAQESYTVAAIIEDVPANSHFDFSVAFSAERINYWGSRIYIKTEPSSNYQNLQKKVNTAVASIKPALLEDPLYKQHFIQPIEDIHLKSNILYELKPPGNYSFIYLIGGFAVFILIITLFNYANFTLAIKAQQGKSIGIKKTMGARNKAVAGQFFLEGILLALVAIPLLGILLKFVIPWFNTLMGVNLSANLLSDYSTLGLLIVLAILLGVVASVAPALFFARKKILKLFDQKLKTNGFERFSIRRYLVVSQFIILISITTVSYFVIQQMRFIENKDLGFRKEGILYTYTSQEKQDIFQERLRQIPEIDHVGNGSALGIETFNQVTYKIEGMEEVFDDANQLYLDYEGLKAYGLESTLDPEESTGTRNIINRTAAEKLARAKNISPEELIGTMIITEPEYTSPEGQIGFPLRIDGIFEDINLFSLREKITPYFITLSPNVRMGGSSIIAFNTKNKSVVLEKVKEAYNSINETIPLELQYLSQNLELLYIKDKQTVQLIYWMNVLAVFLASIGIIGVTVFLVLAKRKEISIRRVLGASETHVMGIAIKEYITLIVIAALVSWPIAFFSSQRWLSNFAYKIEISQMVFPIIALITFIITAVLVGLVALNAARKSPIKSLRAE